MRRTMAQRKLDRRRPAGSLTRRRVQVVIAFGIVLSLFAAWTMLASSGSLDSILRQKGKKGRTVSTASFNSNSPSKEYIYAGGRLVATEEPIATGSLSPPTNLLATVSSSSAAQINLSWTASPSQPHHYQVERSANFSDPGNGFSFVVDVTGTTYTDIPQGSGVPRLYVSSARRQRHKYEFFRLQQL